MTELVKYEAARQALAEAVAVDEVQQIRSKAEAMRIYARQAGDKVLEIQAAQIRFRAERKLGELLIAAKEAGQVRAGRPENRSDKEQFSHIDGGALAAAEAALDELKAPFRVTLEQAGIDRKLSSKAQQIAAMDAAEFERAIERHAEEMRAGAGRVAMDLLKVGAEEKGRAHRRNLAAVLSEQSAALPSGRRYPAVYLDPPWKRQGGIGNRAYENHYPTMTWPAILDYLRQASERLLPDAWAFMWIPRAHLLAPVELEHEVTIAETGEVTRGRFDAPLAWACQLALGMDSYSTCFVWTKTDEDHPDVSGSGLIAWDQDELLLLFKRGAGLPKPEASEKFGSNHRERPREHSRKPDFYRHMIATMLGCDDDGKPLPVLELFARVDAEHPLPPCWDAAGNQAGEAAIEETKLAGDPFAAGEVVTAAADATSDRASAAAAVIDPESVDELVALKVLSDFCHPRRGELADALGPHYQAKGLAYQSGAHWTLREAGWQRLRELAPPPAERVELTEPYVAPPKPQLTLDFASEAPAPEIVDGAIQTRLPVDDDELDEQLALLEILAGHEVDGQTIRHLVSKNYVHCGTTKISVTDEGRAFLAQLVAPALPHSEAAP